MLAYPDFSKEFLITVDASQFACSGILSQIIDGEERPIAYVSKCLNKSKLNKPIIEKELLAIYFTIGIFRPYIYGTHLQSKKSNVKVKQNQIRTR